MNFETRLRRSFWQGLLWFFVLHQIDKAPSYGGKLKKQLQTFGYDVSPGTLYPLLHTLENAALLRSRIKIYRGRTRKYYEITAPGQLFLAEMRQEMSGILQGMLEL